MNTIEINAINAAGFKALHQRRARFSSNPVDLTGFTARMTVRDKVGGTALASSADVIDITIDTAKHTIAISISAADTELITWLKVSMNWSLLAPRNVVTQPLTGRFP